MIKKEAVNVLIDYSKYLMHQMALREDYLSKHWEDRSKNEQVTLLRSYYDIRVSILDMCSTFVKTEFNETFNADQLINAYVQFIIKVIIKAKEKAENRGKSQTQSEQDFQYYLNSLEEIVNFIIDSKKEYKK